MVTGAEGSGNVRGAMTALVTPFKDGEVGWGRVDALVERQIAGGTDWLCSCGTTGESPTLTAKEHEELIERVIARAGDRRPVMAGTGTNSTAETVRRTKHAARAGAKAALVVAPYYNRPTQEGLFRHFAAVAEAAELPIVLYNVPVRTGVNMSADLVVRLRQACPNVVALKDASGVVDGVTEVLSRCDIAVLCGDDALTFPMMCLGAVGVISVVGNLSPALIKSLVAAMREGDHAGALPLHRKLHDLAVGLSKFGPNPVPIKTAMAIKGVLEEEFRLPLCPLDEEQRAGVERLLRRHEMLERIAE